MNKFELQDFYQKLNLLDGVRLGEAALLYKLGSSVPTNGVAVEIGSWMGKSSIAISFGLRQAGGVLHTIDDHRGLPGGDLCGENARQIFFKNLTRAGVMDSVKHHAQSSDDCAVSWQTPIDFLFIDGCHEYEPVKNDVSHYAPHVKIGGVVAFHDVVMPGVWRAIREWSEEMDVGFTGINRAGNIVAFEMGAPAQCWGGRLKRRVILKAVHAACWGIPPASQPFRKIGCKTLQSLARFFLRRIERQPEGTANACRKAVGTPRINS